MAFYRGSRNRAPALARCKCDMAAASKTQVARTLRAFFLELLIYGALVTGYFFAVLHYLGAWLVNLETQHIRIYAIIAIVLIIGQAVVLEAVTTGLMRLLRGGRSE
jgi:hypothetical protein